MTPAEKLTKGSQESIIPNGQDGQSLTVNNCCAISLEVLNRMLPYNISWKTSTKHSFGNRYKETPLKRMLLLLVFLILQLMQGLEPPSCLPA